MTGVATRTPPLMAVPLTKRLAAEAIGTLLLVVFGPGAAVVSQYREHALALEGIAAANGLVILVLIYALGHVSGAHFNPGVTLSFALFRHFQPREVVPYWGAQFGGAIAGAAILLALFGDVANLGATLPSGSEAQSFGIEIVLTFLLVFVITSVATDTRAVGQAAAIAIGATVGLDILVGGPISGGSMNPARSLGPALVSGHLASVWIYLIAPPIGAVVAGLTYELLRGEKA